MKHYAYYCIIFISLLVLGGCRSNNSLSQLSEKDTELHINKKDSATQKSEVHLQSTTNSHIQKNKYSVSQVETVYNKDSKGFEYEEEKNKTTEFNPNGTIRSITESSKRRGRTNQTNERAGSSTASNMSDSLSKTKQEIIVKDSVGITNTESEMNIEKQESETNQQIDESSNDSRWIQGKEWLYVIIPTVVIGGIIYLIRNGRKRSN